MALYELKCNSYLGADTRIQVVKERNPKKINLVRNSEFETIDPPPIPAIRETSDKPRRAKKSRNNHRLSSNARRILQRIGGAISASYPARYSIFLTGTFPGESREYQAAIASQAAWIVSRLKAWIYKRVGANIGYYVWEFQKRGTLHLHYVVLLPEKEDREWIIAEFRNEWIRLLRGASERSGENLFIGRKSRDFEKELHLLRIDAQECYKSAASYLAKYLCKSKPLEFPAPCRMWGATKEARHIVAINAISISIPCLPLHRACEKAYEMDAHADTEPEKRRYWRHRFSEGFTILIYNDSYRMNLSEMQRMENIKRIKPWKAKFLTLWEYIINKGMEEKIVKSLSRPTVGDLYPLLDSNIKNFREVPNSRYKEALLEVRAIVESCGVGNFRTRAEVKNRISAIILEIPND